MIITRSPFRISLGGGGTDLPSYYSKFGGALITAAIDKYMYINVNRLEIEESILLKYSKSERVKDVSKIKHELAREALRLTKIFDSIEISSMADLPAGTGLGSSGSYTVALLKALHTLNGEVISPKALAEEACHIEIDILKKPVGKQDQYIASFGGIIYLEIDKRGEVKVTPLNLPLEIIKKLENDILIFYTNIKRGGSKILKEQDRKTKNKTLSTIKALHKIKEIGKESKTALEKGDTQTFGELLDLHWQTKKSLSQKIANGKIDCWYNLAKKNGAVGGKIMGAGGGGFFMFCCPNDNGKHLLRRALAKEGLVELDYRFDFEGAKILADF